MLAVLDHGRYIAGPEITELEALLCEKTGAAVASACASGTDALIIPLLAKGIGRGDAVFTPAFTYNATVNAILLVGATPVFVDIDPATFNIDPADLERKLIEVKKGDLTPRGVIAVDLFGLPAAYDRLGAISERENLFLLADGAQSYGGELNGRTVGNLAPVTATSFFPGKALGAYGDAGAVFSQVDEDRECFESIRWHGTDEARKESIRVGFNGRMDSFQAAVLLEKLSIFDEELAARRDIAAVYTQRLASISIPQQLDNGARHGYAYYALCVDGRDKVVATLKDHNIPTAIYYSTPLHQMEAFEKFAPSQGLFHTEAASQRIFCLPMHPYLTPSQVDYICDAVELAVSPH